MRLRHDGPHLEHWRVARQPRAGMGGESEWGVSTGWFGAATCWRRESRDGFNQVGVTQSLLIPPDVARGDPRRPPEWGVNADVMHCLQHYVLSE